MAKTIIEFEGLKTSTSFNFKNKTERANYWNYLLMESPLRFKNEYSKFLHEKLHVFFSVAEILRYFTVFTGFLCVLSAITGNGFLVIANISFTLLFFGLSCGFYAKFKSFWTSVIITDEIHTLEFVETLRDMIIADKNETDSIL